MVFRMSLWHIYRCSCVYIFRMSLWHNTPLCATLLYMYMYGFQDEFVTELGPDHSCRDAIASKNIQWYQPSFEEYQCLFLFSPICVATFIFWCLKWNTVRTLSPNSILSLSVAVKLEKFLSNMENKKTRNKTTHGKSPKCKVFFF